MQIPCPKHHDQPTLNFPPSQTPLRDNPSFFNNTFLSCLYKSRRPMVPSEKRTRDIQSICCASDSKHDTRTKFKKKKKKC